MKDKYKITPEDKKKLRAMSKKDRVEYLKKKIAEMHGMTYAPKNEARAKAKIKKKRQMAKRSRARNRG